MPDAPPATSARRPRALAPWVMRAAWVAVLVFGAPALDGAIRHRQQAVGDVAQLGAGVLWLAGVVAIALPSVAGLTATRVIVPLSIPAAAAAWLAGADAVEGSAFVIAALVATLVANSAELGRAFVQASAYGDEDRHPLRPPIAYLLAAMLSWSVWCTLLFGGPLLLADRRWVTGAVCSAAAVLVTAWGWPRWHMLTRRWFVLVPAGVVVHDQLVLAETLMVRRQDLAGLRLAPAGTQAADLTGPASGHAVELLTRQPVTAILAATPRRPGGTVLHLTGGLVSPTRPGRLLAAARRRRFPVG